MLEIELMPILENMNKIVQMPIDIISILNLIGVLTLIIQVAFSAHEGAKQTKRVTEQRNEICMNRTIN